MTGIRPLDKEALRGVCFSSFPPFLPRFLTIPPVSYLSLTSRPSLHNRYQISVVNDGIINSNCTDLTPDQSICLGYSGEDCTTTHVVAANETCDDITTAAGINSTMLFLNNPQIDTACDNIYIGEVSSWIPF